ncbi:hypothetical protein EHS17_03875 [Rhodobacteraceae bacterium CH30]|nr:hypothetical protein EHS17_03875 [Rhodobacteraceae bacterium CH30]
MNEGNEEEEPLDPNARPPHAGTTYNHPVWLAEIERRVSEYRVMQQEAIEAGNESHAYLLQTQIDMYMPILNNRSSQKNKLKL